MTAPKTSMKHPASARKIAEGNVFYPTGYIVAAFTERSSALQALEALQAASGNIECTFVPGDMLQKEALHELEQHHPIAILGHSLQTLEKHLELAREGCDFLLIHASTTAEQALVIRALTGIPVRFAVKYGLFVIEDLTVRLAQAIH